MILARAPGAAQILWEIPRYSSNRDQETRRAAEDEKPPSVMMVTLARHVGRYEGWVWPEGWVMFKRIAITISAVALVMLAIALAPAVPTALATARTTTPYEGDPTLNQPLAD